MPQLCKSRRLLITLSERVGGKPEDQTFLRRNLAACRQNLKDIFSQDVVEPEGFVQGIADLIRAGKGVGFRPRIMPHASGSFRPLAPSLSGFPS